MPNIKSAKKRMELSRAANTRNRASRSRLKTAIRSVREAESVDSAQERLKEAAALLDRAATKNLMPPNRAARIKSQLARQVNQMESASYPAGRRKIEGPERVWRPGPFPFPVPGVPPTRTPRPQFRPQPCSRVFPSTSTL